MMPSRGIRLSKGTAPRVFQLQCRNLSSAPKRISYPPSRPRLSTPLESARWQRSIWTPTMPWSKADPKPPAASVSEPEAILSSAPPSTPTPPPPVEAISPLSADTSPTPPAETISSTTPNYDTITVDNLDLSDLSANIASIPEKIGYLSEIGLDYGWGPTSMLEWVIEHFHIYGGLPWWGSIAATSVVLRIVLFPFYLKSSDVMARQSALASVTKPLTNRMTEAQRAGKQEEMLKALGELREVRNRAGISFKAQFAPIIAQGIFGYCGFKLLRAAANIPIPAFKTDGFFWLSDLTVPDPYLILPLAMAGCIHLIIRMGGETGTTSTDAMTQGMQRFMLWGMPGLIVLGTGFQPGAVCVWFAAGGALGICQSLALQRPAVRNFFGIAPIYKPSKQEAHKGTLQSVLENWNAKPEPSITKRRNYDIGRGKNELYMHPTYQSPILRRTSATQATDSTPRSRVIDVEAHARTEPMSGDRSAPSSTAAADEMLSPSGSPSAVHRNDGASPGVFERASKAWNDGRQRGQVYVQDQEAPVESARVVDQTLTDYEERLERSAEEARKRTKKGKGGR